MHRFGDPLPRPHNHAPLPRDWMERPDPLGPQPLSDRPADPHDDEPETEHRHLLYALIGTYVILGYGVAFALGLVLGSG